MGESTYLVATMDGDAEAPLIEARRQGGSAKFPVAVLLVSVAVAVGCYVAFPKGAVHWVAIVIAALVAGIWLPWTFFERVYRVRVFANRIEQRTLLGTRRLQFDDVERIGMGPYRPSHGRMESTVRHYLVQNGLGAGQCEMGAVMESEVRLYVGRVKISLADGFAGSSAALYRRVAPLVLPRLTERLDQQIDETGGVRFGKLTARPLGVETSRGTIPWHEMGPFTCGPAGVRLTAINQPELTVTVPTKTDNLLVLLEIRERRKAQFWNEVRAKAAKQNIEPAKVIEAIERHTPHGDTFGYPEEDVEFGTHVCTLPPLRFLGMGPRRGKCALYVGGVVSGRRRIALANCESFSFRVIHHYHNGAYVGTWRFLTVVSNDRVKIKLSSRREEAAAFFEALLNRLVPCLIADHTARIARGETMRYGKFALSNDTLTFRRRAIPLSAVRGTSADQGKLFIWTDQAAKPLACDLSALNAMVLNGVLHAAMHQRRDGIREIIA
jgi:hypothetical protein